MKNNFLQLRLLSLFFALSLSAGAQKNFWSDISAASISAQPDQRNIAPDKYRTLSLDTAGLLSFFKTAPEEFTPASKASPVILLLPMPDGSFNKFRIVQTTTMEPVLADRFPNIKTYGGQGVDDPYATLKLDWTLTGLHVIIFSPVNGSVVIDPYATGSLLHYISYNKKDFIQTEPFIENGSFPKDLNAGANGRAARTTAGMCVGGTLRTYRLAVGCTGEYARAIGFGTSVTATQALSAIVTSVNRVNGVYETEAAIRLVLINNNINIVFTNPATDAFDGNKNANTLIDESQQVIDSIIQPANYDIGHVFSTGAGGLAQLGVVCRNGKKAMGVTGLKTPLGDPYDIDYVAHEMGHQFGANHPFNATTGSCGGNAVSSTNAEPGSGSTIMAYAGICEASNNLQPHSDPQFHTVNLDEIAAYTINQNGNSCAVKTATGNTPPVVNAGSDYAIPASTPFMLTGSATDADSDPLTYSWEQVDVGGPFGDWDSPSGDAPLFRSFPPVTTPVRYFPKISDIRNNTTTIGEVLPSYSRTMHFRLTARDNRAGGGGVCNDEIAVAVNGAAGPFLITQPNTAVTWNVGNFETIKWDVASTNTAPINCTNVVLELSTDGGLTFPLILLANTPNDGQEEIIVPNNLTNNARIRVKAGGNIFFDISNENFSIQAANQTGFVFSNPSPVVSCNSGVAGTVINTSAINGYSNPINLSASGNPAGSTIVFSGNPILPGSNDSVSLQGNIAPGKYNITITGTSGSIVKTRVIEFTIGTPNAAPTGISPANNSIGESFNTAFQWSAVSGVQTYNLQISTTAAFTSIVQSINNIEGTVDTLDTPLAANTEYYWRVQASNTCGTGPASAVLRFKTAGVVCGDTAISANVPVTIPATMSTITSYLDIATSGVIADVDVVGLQGTHSYISDLTVSLRSPSNTEINLFSTICGSKKNFNINFDDEASSASIPCPPTGGVRRRPEQPLSAFDNENSAGRWILRIKDGFDSDGGSLDNWGLRICTLTATALPVNWLSFTGQKNENFTVTLQWSTGNEANNDHYEIERSADGTNYAMLDKINAGARPGTVQQYLFNDGHPYSGVNYYRLKQVDNDGHSTYSKVVMIVFDKTGEQYIVYPNPATDISTLRILSAMKQLTVRLFDASGKAVYQKSLGTVNAGDEIKIPVKGLSKGLYILNVTTTKGVSSEKIIVK